MFSGGRSFGNIGYVMAAQNVVGSVRIKLDRLAWDGRVSKMRDSRLGGEVYQFQVGGSSLSVFIGSAGYGVPTFFVVQGEDYSGQLESQTDVLEAAQKVDKWLTEVTNGAGRDHLLSIKGSEDPQTPKAAELPGSKGVKFLAAAISDSNVIPQSNVQRDEGFSNLRECSIDLPVSATVTEDAPIAISYLLALRNSSSWILKDVSYAQFEVRDKHPSVFSFLVSNGSADGESNLVLRGVSKEEVELVRSHVLERSRALMKGEERGELHDRFMRTWHKLG
jgi:hypothetical protein